MPMQIQNNEFFFYSVGANCIRPPDLQHNLTGDQWSPLHKQSIKFALYQYKSDELFLLNHNGRPMVAPTEINPLNLR